jgi:large subunit ribosomal protein L10
VAKVEQKQPIIAEIAANVKDAQSVVLVDYRGLTVEQDTNLRRQLRAAGITYKIYKNTMMTFAFKETVYEGLLPFLKGPSAIAISKEDATAPARLLMKFTKEAPKLELKAGIVEGFVYDAAGVAEVAKIPSREELISKLLGSLQSPITNFARVMNQLAEKGGAGNCEAPAPKDEAPAAEEAVEAEVPAPVDEAPAAEEAVEAEVPAPVEEAPAVEEAVEAEPPAPVEETPATEEVAEEAPALADEAVAEAETPAPADEE